MTFHTSAWPIRFPSVIYLYDLGFGILISFIAEVEKLCTFITVCWQQPLLQFHTLSDGWEKSGQGQKCNSKKEQSSIEANEIEECFRPPQYTNKCEELWHILGTRVRARAQQMLSKMNWMTELRTLRSSMGEKKGQARNLNEFTHQMLHFGSN